MGGRREGRQVGWIHRAEVALGFDVEPNRLGDHWRKPVGELSCSHSLVLRVGPLLCDVLSPLVQQVANIVQQAQALMVAPKVKVAA